MLIIVILQKGVQIDRLITHPTLLYLIVQCAALNSLNKPIN